MKDLKVADKIVEAIHTYQSFLIVSHFRPDGDAIGSQIALGDFLEQLGKKVTYLNEHQIPERFKFLRGADRIQLAPSEPPLVEVLIILDTATLERVGESILPLIKEIPLSINIDHHTSNRAYCDLNYIDDESPATGEILYDFFKNYDFTISPIMRDALYTAVSTDTGSFQYQSTTTKTYQMAADLVAQGLKVGEINAKIYQEYPYRRITLMKVLFQTLERSDDQKIAWWSLTHSMKKEVGFQAGDSEDMIDVIRGIKGVVIAICFEEVDSAQIRISLRSKSSKIDVNKIAKLFGGGGHTAAAGILMKETTLASSIEKLVETVKKSLNLS